MTVSLNQKDFFSIPEKTLVGKVSLNVKNLPAQEKFYCDAFGLSVFERGKGFVILGAGENQIIKLIDAPHLEKARQGSAGLYHVALRFDSRQALAFALKKVLDSFP